MIPVNPSILLISVIFSVLNSGKSIITCGGVVLVYPNPWFTTLMAFIDPFVMVAVAVAVVYVPTLPSDCVNVPIPDTGPEIFTETVPL